MPSWISIRNHTVGTDFRKRMGTGRGWTVSGGTGQFFVTGDNVFGTGPGNAWRVTGDVVGVADVDTIQLFVDVVCATP